MHLTNLAEVLRVPSCGMVRPRSLIAFTQHPTRNQHINRRRRR